MADLTFKASNYSGLEVGISNDAGYTINYRSTYSFVCPAKTDKLKFSMAASWQGIQNMYVDYLVNTNNTNDAFTKAGTVDITHPSGSANNTWKDVTFTITVTASSCGLTFFSNNTTYYLHLYGRDKDRPSSNAPHVVMVGLASNDYVIPKGAKHHTSTVASAATTYTVTFNANGGSGAPSSQTKTIYQNLTLTSNTPKAPATEDVATYNVTFDYNGNGTANDVKSSKKTRSYSFLRWNTKADGSGTNYTPGATYTSDAPLTLYAIYSSSTSTTSVTVPNSPTWGNQTATYTVTYNPGAKGGSNTTATATKTTTHSFLGWNSKTDGTGTSVTSGDSYTPEQTIKFYARWNTSSSTTSVTLPSPTWGNTTDTPWTITYDYQGGSGTPPSVTPTRTSTHSFSKWNTKSDGSGTSLNGGASYIPPGDITLYARWNTNTPSSVSITLPTATKTGYELLGWGTSAGATSYTAPGASYSVTQTRTLYAIWKALGLVRIYDSNGTPNQYQCYIYTGTGPYNGWDLFAPYIGNGSQSGTGFDLITG